MANADSVSQNTQDYFGNYLLARGVPVSLATAANAVVALPYISGGLQGTGKAILRRITVYGLANSAGGAVPSAATANISLGQTNDGANLVTTTFQLSNVINANTYQDITLVAAAGNTTYTNDALFVNVVTAVANATVKIDVWGEVKF